MEDGIFIKFSVGGLCGESIMQYVNSNICTLRFGLGVKNGLSIGGGPRMQNISYLS